jgi:site-specific recombinase XerC
VSNYAGRLKRPRTLTELEQERLLKVTGEHRDGFRDHMIISLALGTGLRELEIVSLDVHQVVAFTESIAFAPGAAPPVVGDDGDQHVRRRVQLVRFKGSGRAGGRRQEVILSDAVRYKLQKYLQLIRGRLLTAPLFVSREGGRLSTRQVRTLFARWQQRAGFETRHSFHVLRHTYCSSVYRESGRDLVQVQQLARHSRVETSLIYTQASDDELLITARRLKS